MRNQILIVTILAFAKLKANAQELWFDYSLSDGSTLRASPIADFDRRDDWFPEDKTYRLLFRDTNTLQVVDTFSIRSEKKVFGKNTGFFDWIKREKIAYARSPLSGWTKILQATGSYHAKEDGYGDFALDFTIEKDGKRFQRTGRKNTDYFVFGVSIYSPVTGRLVDRKDDLEDRPPGPLTPEVFTPAIGKRNNYIGIQVAEGIVVYLLHLKKSSIPKTLAIGQRIKVGTYLGQVGNAGVTTEPHLHLVTLFWDKPRKRYWSLPNRFQSLPIKDNPESPTRQVNDANPLKNQWVYGK